MLKIEVIRFEAEDIITSSLPNTPVNSAPVNPTPEGPDRPNLPPSPGVRDV